MPRRRLGFTTRASCLLAAGLTAVLCGLVLGETDLLRAGVLAAAVPCAAAVVVHRSRVRVANRRSLDPSHISAGQSVTIHLTITNRSVLPTGALMLEDQLPERLPGRARFVLDSLSGREARTVSYRLPALGRGRYRTGPLRIRLGDPFHMIDLTRSFTATSEFVVTPVVETLPPLDQPRSDELGSGGGSHSVGSHGADDASTREYRIGDDLRKIHWKSSARTGALMVRQEERPWRTQTTVILDLRADAHETSLDDGQVAADPRLTSSLEWGISAAASAATQSMHAGRDVGLVCDPVQKERLRFAEPGGLARHLAGVRPQRHPGLESLAAPLRAAARDSSLVAVLGRVGAADLRLLADTNPRGASAPSLAMLIDVESWMPALDAEGAGQGSSADDDASADIRAAAELLRSSGWRVVVVHRAMTTIEAWSLLRAGLSAGRHPASYGVGAMR